MSDEQRPQETGRHLLGPHVVGQRVVVRRLVRGESGPTGGPAMTDLLGVCLAWGGGACVVQPETGPAVRIALADIVSGKPVPPRASVRQRVSLRDAELRVARLWPAVDTTELGEWQLRTQPSYAGRLVKRANSCLALGDPGVAVEEALAEVERFYTERERPALLQVEDGGDVEVAARRAGWVDLDPPTGNEFRLASLSQVRRALRARPRPAGGPTTPPVELSAVDNRATGSIGSGCDPQAEGSATVDGDWVGLHGISVDPTYRRRGLATAMVGELLEWAAEQGAMTVWLQVEPGDVPAMALWDSLGLVPHHRCRYLRPSHD